MKFKNTAVLLILCDDKDGIVADVTTLLARLGANIVYLDQHTDRQNMKFFMRVEWDLEKFSVGLDDFKTIFTHDSAKKYNMSWELHRSEDRQKMAIFVSKYAHCFFDIISRWKTKEFEVDIPLVISNHEDLREEAGRFGIPYYHIPITKENRSEQTQEQIELLQKHNVDFVVLARYMQIIPPEMIAIYKNRIINIHHSFLPGFPGAKPYHQAFERGVKIIGATGHYVTEELDAGPIIEQAVQRVSHKHSVEDLIATGQDIERRVLARAVKAHIERRILTDNNRTVVFS
ncbi:MAG: formyltetrahydrofolate deformylase [Chitinispirillales bacterium]|jgi:formyltetrahydrofolate deformylase|nr:formyltetrahydrofolate deformylase [Chitinispirillales bacterium]